MNLISSLISVRKKIHKIWRFSIMKSPYALIFLYHRINNSLPDPQKLCVNENNFEKHLIFFKNNFQMVSLEELAERTMTKNLFKGLASITFDDGYKDNFYNAKPLLEKYSVPATFFVTVGMIGCKREFWWDELQRIFLESTFLPENLILNVSGEIYRYSLETYKERKSTYSKVHDLIRNINTSSREKVLANLFTWSKQNLQGRRDFLCMNKNEIRKLGFGNLFEIGSHSMSHPVLVKESQERQFWEIKTSKLRLEKIIKKTVKTFSYPFGSPHDADRKSMESVREAGYLCGISNEQGYIDNNSNPYWLRRILVRDISVQELKKTISESI